MKKIKTLFIIGAFLPILALGSRLEGVVRDAQTGQSLPGATVHVKGSTIGAMTDTKGFYVLDNIPEGNQIIVVSFLGYEDFEFGLNAVEKSKFTKNIALVTSSTQLNEVIINERAGGEIRTLNRQREAENIVTLVSREQILSFPDINAADAIQRVSGVTLQRDQGDGRYVQLRGTPPGIH
jgi:hypothetical protein